MAVHLAKGWDIDSLSGVWILAGTAIAYCIACLAIAFGQRYYQHRHFKKAREQRSQYYLTLKKDQENENNN